MTRIPDTFISKKSLAKWHREAKPRVSTGWQACASGELMYQP